jgi:hypothetical protein
MCFITEVVYGLILQISFVPLLYPLRNDITLKITIELVIDHY